MSVLPKILIKYASRSRPQRMFCVLDSIFNNITNPKQVTVLLTLDSNDNSVFSKENIDRLQKIMRKHENLRVFTSQQTTKVDAFNRDIDKIKDWDFLLHVTDFTEICVKGFDDKIMIMNNFGLPPFTQFKSVNSNGSNEHYMTLITRDRYKQDKYLYNPKFKSNYYADELVQKSELAEGTIYFDGFHRYVHPKWLYYRPDHQLVNNLLNWKQDLETLEKIMATHRKGLAKIKPQNSYKF